MPLPASIDVERTALARIVAGLFALLGLTAASGRPAPTPIARALHRTVSLVLRPAESAVRRLVAFIALSITVRPLPARQRPGDVICRGEGPPRPAFRLFDMRLRLVRRAKAQARPRIWVFGNAYARPLAPPRRQADGPLPSAPLLRRLDALTAALDDLPRQARRLARALQRRKASAPLKGQGPLRPGHPPGHRQRRQHEVDDILRRCHALVRNALPPDTS